MIEVRRLPEFDAWLSGLKDGMTQKRRSACGAMVGFIAAEPLLRDGSIVGNLGDIKQVGEGVFEMREFFGPGWRLYYAQRGAVLIVMLGGGDK